MATMKSKQKFIYDGHASVVFKAAGSAAITATGVGAVLDLQPLTQAYWDNHEIPNRELTIAVAVIASDAGNSDETYKITAEVATDSAFTVPVEVAEAVVPRGVVGAFPLVIDMDAALASCPNAAFIRTKATLGGTTPSLQYVAWMVKGEAT